MNLNSVVAVGIAACVGYLVILFGGYELLKALRFRPVAEWWMNTVGLPWWAVSRLFITLDSKIVNGWRLVQFFREFEFIPKRFSYTEQGKVESRLKTLAREASKAFGSQENARRQLNVQRRPVRASREEKSRYRQAESLLKRKNREADQAKRKFWRAHKAAKTLGKFPLRSSIKDYYN